MKEVIESVEKIIKEVVVPQANNVDQNAEYPHLAVEAFKAAGLLGLVSGKDVGGMGHGIETAANVIERIARECGTTAMVMCMHYSGAFTIDKLGNEKARRKLAQGDQLSTLAFSEKGSRSHFWAPMSSAKSEGNNVVLNAEKSWITSAKSATMIVWSSRPLAAEGASSIWIVDGESKGLERHGPFTGLGLRGNDSTPVTATNVTISSDALLGKDGEGLSVMLETVLPNFNAMIAATSIGLMQGALDNAISHVSGARYAHMDSSLADLPTIRAYVARMKIAVDQSTCLWLDGLDAIANGREDAMLRVLQIKASAGETATSVLDLAMRVCGGAAFRKDVGIERRFRDARAGTVMAPTTDQLYDFIGKAVCGLPVF